MLLDAEHAEIEGLSMLVCAFRASTDDLIRTLELGRPDPLTDDEKRAAVRRAIDERE